MHAANADDRRRRHRRRPAPGARAVAAAPATALSPRHWPSAAPRRRCLYEPAVAPGFGAATDPGRARTAASVPWRWCERRRRPCRLARDRLIERMEPGGRPVRKAKDQGMGCRDRSPAYAAQPGPVGAARRDHPEPAAPRALSNGAPTFASRPLGWAHTLCTAWSAGAVMQAPSGQRFCVVARAVSGFPEEREPVGLMVHCLPPRHARAHAAQPPKYASRGFWSPHVLASIVRIQHRIGTSRPPIDREPARR